MVKASNANPPKNGRNAKELHKDHDKTKYACNLSGF
jgi:hypothetical protein